MLDTLKARIDRIPAPSHRLVRTIALVNLILQGTIAVTGSIVRVTGSGLGCPTWPECFPGSMVPVEHPEYEMLNQWIEFGNRLLNGVIGAGALAVFAAVWLSRPRRSRVVKLAVAMPAGVLFQGVLGGITVRTNLLWWTVALHLIASAVLVWFAFLLLHAINDADGPPRKLVPPVVSHLLVVAVVVLGGLVVAGTMVTGAGPHAGDRDVPRLNLPVETLAHVHASLLYTFLALLLIIGAVIWRTARHERKLWRRYLTLVAVVLAQGLIGVVQFLTDVPGGLVVLHVLGAMSVIVATAAFWCATTDRAPHTEDAEQAEVRVPA
ncbi:cytochrome c oxidase assembly protein subunit 15 [Herbihabitans rhizosphaerae]|uniref:Cytochrome c oxidase assembly protein subunit 15 n=1 Tax=Herbihabitans rhizosphaerae TaxID=1872711 RepID=A0A4Q7L1E6_9PSEU|nr:COX15/CtaA family protein [Herbihabitans rhizosphaerae]RZS43329.1 cytochrome c oxidase assembly protein subunit 15 [Herbihabitans rhizosphaerae]